jgi:hypothetical protein
LNTDTWFFQLEPDAVLFTRRAEGDGGLIGDASWRATPETRFVVPGLTYDALRAAGGGTITFAPDNSTFRIERSPVS